MGCSWAAASGVQRAGAYCFALCTACFNSSQRVMLVDGDPTNPGVKLKVLVVIVVARVFAADDVQIGGFALLHYTCGLLHESGVDITRLLLSASANPDVRAADDDSFICRFLVRLAICETVSLFMGCMVVVQR